MQSGIGDYIHYRRYRYRYYGIGYKEKEKISSSQALNNQKKTLKMNGFSTPIASNVLEEIRATIESIMYPNQKNSNYTSLINNEEQERVRKNIENFVKQWGEHIELDWNSGGGLYGSKGGSSIKRLGLTEKELKKKKNIDKAYIKVATIAKRVNQFRAAIKRQIQKKIISKKDAEKLYNNLNIILGEMDKAGIYVNSKSKQNIKYNSKNRDFINRLNALFVSLSYPKKKILGEVLENVQAEVIKNVSNFANKTGSEIVYKYLDDVKGTTKKEVFVDNNLGSSIDKDTFLKNTEIVEHLSENSILTSKLSLGKKTVKADVTMIMTDVDGKKYSIGFSDKNYFGSNLSVVSKTPLLDLLLDQNAAFITHYFNMIAVNETNTHSIVTSNYIKEIKRVIAVKALQGAVSNLQGYSADYLVLNDRQKKKVVIKSIGEIISNIEKKSSIENYFTITPDINNITASNVFVESASGNSLSAARVRIANVLAQARKEKITASMKKDALYL